MKDVKIKRLNIFDFALLIVVISLIVGSYLKINHKQLSLLSQREMTAYLGVDVYLTGEDADKLQNGQSITEPTSSEVLGKITNVWLIYDETTNDADDAIRQAPVSAHVRIKTSVKRDETGIYINAKHFIAPGMQFEFALENNLHYIGKVNTVSLPK